MTSTRKIQALEKIDSSKFQDYNYQRRDLQICSCNSFHILDDEVSSLKATQPICALSDKLQFLPKTKDKEDSDL